MNDLVKRDRTIDIIKGVAIFLMLWGHCIQCGYLDLYDFYENPVFKAIYSFHMPLFMLVSGYLLYVSSLKYNDFRICLKKKIYTLAKAIVLGAILCFVFGYVCLHIARI